MLTTEHCPFFMFPSGAKICGSRGTKDIFCQTAGLLGVKLKNFCWFNAQIETKEQENRKIYTKLNNVPTRRLKSIMKPRNKCVKKKN